MKLIFALTLSCACFVAISRGETNTTVELVQIVKVLLKTDGNAVN